MSLSKEAKVGLLVTTILVIIYLGFNYLKGKEIFPTTQVYYTLYNNAQGLSAANEVMLNGFKVGRIQQLDILPDQGYKVLVKLVVDKNIKLTNTTVAKLESSNLLGGKVISLLIKEGSLLQHNDTLLSETEQDLQTKLAESTLPMLNDVKSITLLTNQFMQNLVENTDRINAIFSSLEKTSEQIRQAVTNNQTDLSTISHNIAEISGSLSDQEIGIRPLLTKLKQVVQEVEVFQINELTTKLNAILTTLESGGLYEHIDQTLLDLDKLLTDLRINPSRYVHFSILGANSIFSRNKKPISKSASTPMQHTKNTSQATIEK